MINEYFPSLNTIVQLNDLPEQLNFLQDAINNSINSTLDDLYFRNYQVSESEEGDMISYELDIISNKKLDFDILGTGLTLSLDTTTNFNQTNFSSIPGNP